LDVKEISGRRARRTASGLELLELQGDALRCWLSVVNEGVYSVLSINICKIPAADRDHGEVEPLHEEVVGVVHHEFKVVGLVLSQFIPLKVDLLLILLGNNVKALDIGVLDQPAVDQVLSILIVHKMRKNWTYPVPKIRSPPHFFSKQVDLCFRERRT